MTLKARTASLLATAFLTAACNQRAVLPAAPNANLPAQSLATVDPKSELPKGPPLEDYPPALDDSKCVGVPANHNSWCGYLNMGDRLKLSWPATPRDGYNAAEMLSGFGVVDYAAPDNKPHPADQCATLVVGPGKPRDPNAEKWRPASVDLQLSVTTEILPIDAVRNDPDFFTDPDAYYKSRLALVQDRPGSASDGQRALIGCAPDTLSEFKTGIWFDRMTDFVGRARAQKYMETHKALDAKLRRETITNAAIVIPATRREP